MARNETISIAAGAWTQATNANATSVRVQNLSNGGVRLQATNGATAPASHGGSLQLASLQTMAADLTLAQLWPGVSGANRIWVYSDLGGAVSVSHADG